MELIFSVLSRETGKGGKQALRRRLFWNPFSCKNTKNLHRQSWAAAARRLEEVDETPEGTENCGTNNDLNYHDDVIFNLLGRRSPEQHYKIVGE